MFGERFDDISPDLQRPILCQRCQSVTDVPDVRLFRTVEPRFLRNDYVPSVVEMSELKDVLEKGNRELKRYEEDIAVLRQTLERLENTKSAVENTTRQCRAAISAQRRVPVEIWEMIFSIICLSLCEYSFDVDYSDSPLLGLPTTIVSQVCFHWRTIAKSSLKLWSSIDVNLSNPSYNVALPLEVYFSNSRDYPLKLRIEGDGPITASPYCVNLWKSLSRHMHRSRELTMAMEDWGDIGDLPPVQRLTFPNLGFYCEEITPPDELVWPWFWQAIRKSTKLAVVSSFIVNRVLRAIPFSQLTNWDIHCIECCDDVDDFLDVAQSCTALKSLTLSDILSHDVPDFPVAAREVKLPSLRQLSITTDVDEYSWLAAIFGSLDMPSLETCDISHYAWPLPSELLDMVRRSSTSLKQLRLTLLDGWDACSSSDPLLLDILQAVPRLTDLELAVGEVPIEKIQPYTAFIDDMISALLSKFEDEPPDFFLPQLHYFSLVVPCATLNTELVKRVLEVVSARQGTSHPLTQFHLVRRSDYGDKSQFKPERFVMERELLERIRMLDEGRVKVVIQDDDP
ncbi:hypothetical protein E1B28_006989 [Marasmius oreades]|uniref:F-box domain-containing protein n=1 Tax=Marasmius oreades TaxID=181124 RepID=A0A9P7S226_9AGAR|nr:uncharacterized protein E1B28_006989 [Marasmius oreades]KAG7093306.1 hypothetical protein E1B28_006989 [Marasmius oreades]